MKRWMKRPKTRTFIFTNRKVSSGGLAAKISHSQTLQLTLTFWCDFHQKWPRIVESLVVFVEF